MDSHHLPAVLWHANTDTLPPNRAGHLEHEGELTVAVGDMPVVISQGHDDIA